MKRSFRGLIPTFIFVTFFFVSYAFAGEDEGVGKPHCPDKVFACYEKEGRGVGAGTVDVPQCWTWKWLPPGCHDCHTSAEFYAKYTKKCNDQAPKDCKGKCWACDRLDTTNTTHVNNCYDLDGHMHTLQ
ncbi:MAG: hypothetical protein CVU52_03005 [Deltaproteobacteria bacterium HGW-Deltaproteobacteria-10]|nr:MAG: hypothetical protein CVU52_03005 [Deltaproteobacteria bacterium HGW-Deltaproteobacteria-10]